MCVCVCVCVCVWGVCVCVCVGWGVGGTERRRSSTEDEINAFHRTSTIPPSTIVQPCSLVPRQQTRQKRKVPALERARIQSHSRTRLVTLCPCHALDRACIFARLFHALWSASARRIARLCVKTCSMKWSRPSAPSSSPTLERTPNRWSAVRSPVR